MNVGDVTQLALAAATVCLAAGTFWMALETRKLAAHSEREVEVAHQQLDVATDALRASIRPWLSELPPTADRDDRLPYIMEDSGEQKISIPLRNVGNGIALIEKGSVKLWPAERVKNGIATYQDGEAEAPIVPPGGDTSLDFKLRQRPADQSWYELYTASGANVQDNEFVVSVRYTDVNGGQPVQAKIHIRHGKVTLWHIAEIEYYHSTDSIPFAVAGGY